MQTNSTVSVYLDAVLPVGKVTNASGTTMTNGGYASSAIKYTASDSGSGVYGYQYKKPGATSWSSYTSGTAVTGTGWHTWRCYDRAYNYSAEYRVYYDAMVPTGMVYGGTTAVGSGSYTNAAYVKYAASDAASGVSACYVKMPDGSSYTAYTSGTQLTTDGLYYFYCVDKAGLSSSVLSITKDTVSPTGTLYAGTSMVASGTRTNASYIKFIPYDAIGAKAIYVMKPNDSTWVAYTSGMQLTSEGEYSFYAVDNALNESPIYTITIDRNIPTAQLFVDDIAVGNNTYTNGAHIRFECEETCYVKTPDSTEFKAYITGIEYYKAGRYEFYGVSEAGNSTGVYVIVIDRESKPLTSGNVANGTTNGDATITWTDGDGSTTAPIKTVTVNGLPYTKGTPIYTIDTGVYLVECVDSAGNEWTTEFKSTKQNVLTETFQKEFFEAADKDGNYYTFSTYESALQFAIAREREFVRTGTWSNASWDAGLAMDAVDSINAMNGTYYIYKKSGNATEEVAYFTQERLEEVLTEYAKIGLESYYYWEKEYAPIAEGENLFGYSAGKTILANAITLGENIGWTVDGVEFVGKEYIGEGKHVLTVSDSWGNTCDYAITVVRRVPDMQYAVGDGGNNLVSFDRVYYFKDFVNLSIIDRYDEMAMFCVLDESGALIGNYSLDEICTIEESGAYTMYAVNHFGKTEIFNFVISRNAPTIQMDVNEEGKKLEVRIAESVDDESHIKTLELYKSIDGGATWVLIEKDDYGVAVALGTYAYNFRTSGVYKVVLTDEFRTGIDAIVKEIVYTQAAPVGVLEGVEDCGYTNGDVSFTWNDEAIATLTKDGDVIAYKSGELLTEDGAYSLIFENYDGYKIVYAFVIDKENPEVVLVGAKANLSVKTDVTVRFEAEGHSAVLFKDVKELGAYLSGTAIQEVGSYRVVVTDLAKNQTEVSFVIDKAVDVEINVNDGGAANAVTITANEEVDIVFIKDGKKAEYELGSEITDPGFYEVKLVDRLGNVKEIGFTIIQPKVQAFTFNFDNTPDFVKALVDGTEKRLNYGTLELFEDGTYEVGVVVGSKTYTFTVTVDSTAPTLEITGVENEGTTKGSVVLTEISEEANIRVFRNDEEIQYTLGDKLKGVGAYRVVLEDECGNTTEYTFTIAEKTSGAWIALGAIGVLAIGGVVTFLILKKKKVV